MKRLLASLRSFRFTEGGVSRQRIALLVLAFAAVHLVIAGRLVLIGMKSDPQVARRVTNPDMLTSTRPDILDREGKQLATDIQSAMLYAEPKKGVGYVDDAVDQLRTVFPDLDERELREKLSSKKGFVRLRREITAEQQHEVRKLGIPHVGFLQESKRVYPAANEASHVLGGVNVDSAGIAGIEKWIDSGGLADLHLAGFATGRSLSPVQLALDLDVQHAMRDELLKAQGEYQAKSMSGMVLDVRTGEILSMVSLPDYDPNKPGNPADLSRLNRLTTGVYEMGSTFKALTVAMALDSGKATLASRFDATAPLHHHRLPRPAPRAHRAGSVHLFVEHRCGEDRARGRRRRAQGVPEKDGPARPAAHGTPGKCDASRAEELGRDQHRDDFVRPRACGRALAGGDGNGRARERRALDPADFPETLAGGSGEDREARHQAGDERQDALPPPPQCREGDGEARRGRRLLCRRQDRHFREGRARPLLAREAAYRLHRRFPLRRAAISCARHDRRAEKPRAFDGGPQRRPHHRPNHCPDWAFIGRRAAA